MTIIYEKIYEAKIREEVRNLILVPIQKNLMKVANRISKRTTGKM